jgi:hypothetical protein
MTTDPQKIKEARAKERENTQHQFREAIALEQIADTLEAIRIEFVGLQQFLMRKK